MAVHIAEVRCDETIARKLRQKHGITIDQVREALQWPARPDAYWDDDPEHGVRLICIGKSAAGREVFAVLLPRPEWDVNGGVWVVKTARWLS